MFKNKRFYLLSGFLLFLTQFINIVRYDLGLEGILFYIAAAVFCFFYFANVKGGIRDNFAVLFLVFYVWITTMAGAAFQLLGNEYYSYEQYQALAAFGGKLYFILF